MKGRKPFDRKLYAKYDELARKYSRSELIPLGYVVKDNPRKTGVDLIVEKDDEIIFYVECEIKKALEGGKFPYDEVNLPERKKKYVGLKYPTLFMIFDPLGEHLICFWDKWIDKCNLEEVHNRYMRQGEYFFKIPLKWTDKNAISALKRLWKRNVDTEV